MRCNTVPIPVQLLKAELGIQMPCCKIVRCHLKISDGCAVGSRPCEHTADELCAVAAVAPLGVGDDVEQAEVPVLQHAHPTRYHHAVLHQRDEQPSSRY